MQVGKRMGTIVEQKVDKYKVQFDGERQALPTNWYTSRELKRKW